MAFQVVTTKTNQLEKSLLGYIALSVDEWDTNNEPEIVAGSKIEIGGSLYEITVLEDIDPDGNFAGFANSTIVYGYLDPNNLKSVLTQTAPEFNQAKNGYYDIATSTYRYYLKFYKDSGGNYTQKSIYLNEHFMKINTGIALNTEADGDHIIRFATDASINYDESDSQFGFDKNINVTGNIVASGGIDASSNINSTEDIIAEKYLTAGYGRTPSTYDNSFAGGNKTGNYIFDLLHPHLKSPGDKIIMTGLINWKSTGVSTRMYSPAYISLDAGDTKIYIWGLFTTSGAIGPITANNGDTDILFKTYAIAI